MAPVRLLPPDLVNKIAAGEVVERPASVVKELAENAVDAGARSIRVQLSGGGLTSISVIDDGHGMSRDDARLSVERHATSKLPDDEALFHIATKGFRGEALPTIASVSHFVLQTSQPGAVEGTKLSIDGGGAVTVERAAAIGGTRVDVNDLFFNTPARRKFLKREATELGHCEEAVVRLALAHPNVGFFVEHDGRKLLTAAPAPGDHRERIIATFGPEVAPHLLPIDERRLGVSVTGFVASPEFTLSNARGLMTFVNSRYVRDRGLNAAVQRAFQDGLPPGRQPVAVVLIELDPRAVDVNVHPQKLEVRFADLRQVTEAVGAAITRALRAAPWRTQASTSLEEGTHAHYAQAVERFLARAQPALFEPSTSAVAEGGHPGFGTQRPQLNQQAPPGYFAALRLLGELGQRFWVCEAPGGTLVVVDPRAVKQRLALHALQRAMAEPRSPRLFAQRVELPSALASKVSEHHEALRELGVELEPFGGTSFTVTQVPEILSSVDLLAMMSELLTVLPAEQGWGPALSVLARHAAAGPLTRVTHDEAHRSLALLDQAQPMEGVAAPAVIVRQVPLLDLIADAD